MQYLKQSFSDFLFFFFTKWYNALRGENMPVEIMGVTLYNLREVAEKLGVSYLTAKTYRKNGKITGQRIGRSFLVSEDELRRFVEGGAPRQA